MFIFVICDIDIFFFLVNYYLVKIIEVTRIHLFNIATQYNAIFSDDEPILLLNKIENMQSNIFYNWIIDMV